MVSFQQNNIYNKDEPIMEENNKRKLYENKVFFLVFSASLLDIHIYAEDEGS